MIHAATNGWGDFFRTANEARTAVPSPLWHKIYMEGAELQRAFDGGDLDRAYSLLRATNLHPYEMKLHDSDRLVFYFDPQSALSIGEVEGALQQAGVVYRGPAQDVWQIGERSDGTLALRSANSNDNALQRSPSGWNRNNPQPYRSEKFLEEYLRLCAEKGKSPRDPYRLSFVMVRLAIQDPRLLDPDFLARFSEMATPYPIVVRPYPPRPFAASRPVARR